MSPSQIWPKRKGERVEGGWSDDQPLTLKLAGRHAEFGAERGPPQRLFQRHIARMSA
jgi:hypothetical protein